MYSFSPAINLHNLTNFILLLLFDQSLKTHNIFIPSKSFFHKHWKYQYTASFQQQSLYYFYCFHKTLKYISILQPQSYFSCYAYLPTTHNLTRQPKTWPILCRAGEPPHSRSSSQARVISGRSKIRSLTLSSHPHLIPGIWNHPPNTPQHSSPPACGLDKLPL